MSKTKKLPEENSRSEESKTRILLAAADIFSRKGLDGARVDEIAAAAQINKRMIYHYYGSKENLYVEVLRYNYNKIYVLSKGAFVPGDDPRENVRRALRRYFYFLAQDEEFVRLVSWEALNRGRYGSMVLPQLLDLAQSDLGEILQDGINRGIFRPDLDIRQVLLSIHALCLVYFTRREMIQPMWPQDLMSEDMLESRLQHILDFVFNGILKHDKA
ncbi:transcriptional regulator, TetR family [Desulfotomaculum nigrificans CO-1-SRB]|uniref:Transcriptional regulator, TetR family n=1 Tax=Desulfotomaculum nigrificans (strain DSM 14880 / VKM B-2319 / CO-1-SRB) TaxID=868595 RepID=F6B4X9_DESCC|nr:TetR/AcrR family transcriptional regulator [Desulfotomaculum nigrificans]AEF95351.1 transcriptional regulator, TetR family [Desulfotomaculum nigrificans CO-1-SRB]